MEVIRFVQNKHRRTNVLLRIQLIAIVQTGRDWAEVGNPYDKRFYASDTKRSGRGPQAGWAQ